MARIAKRKAPGVKGTESLTRAREGIRTPNLLIRRMKCVDAFCIQTFQPFVSLLTHTQKVTRSIRGPNLFLKYDTKWFKDPSHPRLLILSLYAGAIALEIYSVA